MGVIRWRYYLTWACIIGFVPGMIALLLWDWRIGLAVLALLGLLGWLDYRAYAARTNAFAAWAWVVTCYLRATRMPLERLAVHTAGFKELASQSRRFLDPKVIPERQGQRPQMVYGLPHRQLNQHPEASMRASFKQRLQGMHDLRELAPREIKFTPSIWELTGAEALIVQDCSAATCSCELNRAKGEFAHLHSHDGSMHMMLSPADIVTVINRQWGDLFAISGGFWGKVPHIALVYAPRSAEEEYIVSRILQASYAFATTAREAA